jgi:osmotically-inducible protein OsmY
VNGDDAAVEQRIRSEALRDVGIPSSDIDLTVDDGVVTLVGSVPGDKSASDLVARVQKVPGVAEVAAMLRVVNDGGS